MKFLSDIIYWGTFILLRTQIRVDKVEIYNTRNEELRDIVEVLTEENDVFVAPNTMYIPKRRVKNIRQFRSLFQDIDCQNVGLEKSETFRADKKATGSARVLRLPGTINSKNQLNCEVLYIDDALEYSMYELRDKYLNYNPKSYQLQIQDTKGQGNKVISNKFFNSYSLHMQRVCDLQTLCKIRNFDMKGYRNMIIHCYLYWKGIYNRNLDELKKEVIKLNNSFKELLKHTEVKAILRCISKAIEKFIEYEQGLRNGEIKKVSKRMMDKEGYWYKNTALIKRLGIT
ncbi:hypothetical protein [Paraclostridium sp. AKS73]|uniref:hypothetical protein n=1 Tax=Paraclostridium sp. AKS73 TaxID=2876116 RepID=UPI0021E0E44B|nr:hypothetical protein [Paraclostridium sp. AKS73]